MVVDDKLEEVWWKASVVYF